jgi:hypothetical protein
MLPFTSDELMPGEHPLCIQPFPSDDAGLHIPSCTSLFPMCLALAVKMSSPCLALGCSGLAPCKNVLACKPHTARVQASGEQVDGYAGRGPTGQPPSSSCLLGRMETWGLGPASEDLNSKPQHSRMATWGLGPASEDLNSKPQHSRMATWGLGPASYSGSKTNASAKMAHHHAVCCALWRSTRHQCMRRS